MLELPPPGGFVVYDSARARDEAPAPLARERVRAALNGGVEAALAGAHDDALARFDEAAAALEPTDHYGRLLVTLNRAQALVARGDLATAEDAAADALRLARREKDDYWTALAQLGLALAQVARGKRADARGRLGEAARAFARAGDAPRQVLSHYLLGEIAYLSEDPIRAGSHYRDGLAVARQTAAQEWIDLLTSRFEHR